MARPIPDMDKMQPEELAANDLIIIDDTSAGETKTMEVGDFFGLPKVGWQSILDTLTYSSWNATTRTGVLTAPSDATLKYSPGMRFQWTQATGGLKTAIIVGVTSTSITVFLPTGTTLTNETVTAPYFSVQKVPYGFNPDPSRWRLSVSTIGGSQGAGSYGTYYNYSGLNLIVPMGSWRMSFSVNAGQTNSTAAIQASRYGLSTSPNSSSDDELIGGHIVRVSSTSVSTVPTHRSKVVYNAAQTTWYFVFNIETGAGSVQFAMATGYGQHVVYAECAYL